MTTPTPTDLAAPLAAYFAAADAGDTPARARLFATDAVVVDERETHAGADSIEAWMERTQRAYSPRYEVLGSTEDAGRTVVSFRVSGTFPGSPATLRQAFTLRDGMIAKLETL